ncbi:MAG: high-affinity Fe2+/Pb2+ permease [Cellulomonas sp. 73-92]|uniref:iron uptake transporter permease EfeU n=1 Tax=Cellulomonas sp. 73-92 TaxID=1895740 RepID=UPI0009265D64|nr:iron uptake transporter permease EfeU [Cellulomonas sp. 73-92]OJV83529.1 MAG: high-affinity Fe2+/Pb2+ permease [Cellulomonas sp. 73-92]
MLANFLIGLREGLEAALVVGILVAYLARLNRRELLPALWSGVAVAVGVSLAFGALLTFGPSGLGFEAQEALGGTLSILTVGLVTWMIFWMARTARHLKGDLQHELDGAVAVGRRAVLVVALMAVGREGLETALFLWSGAQATGRGSAAPLVGAALGLAVAVGLGWALYKGSIHLDLRKFFGWTGMFLVLIAAGVLAYGVHDLQEAGVLPGLGSLAFDVSRAVPPTSWYGTLLKGVFSFSPETTWLQAVVWVLYVVPVMTFFVRIAWARPRAGAPARPQPTAVTAA